MPEEPALNMTRKQLYDEIWEISVAGLARKYNIPYSQLMKQIKAAAIPIPSSGYWTLLNLGKPTTQPELPEPADSIISIYKTVPRTRTKKKKVESPLTKVVKEEQQPAENGPVSVADPPLKEATSSPASDTSVSTVIEGPAVLAPPVVINKPETFTRYGQTYNVYDRETLYKEVWAAPVTEVAKRYKVSDVAIHKVCKSLEIPTPPLGYWAKLRAGKSVSVIPLPKSDKASKKHGIRTGTTYQQEPEKEVLAFLSEEDRSVILAIASQILLPDEDARMHPKIIAHRKVVEEWKKQHKNDDNKGWNRRNSEPASFLADSISDEALPRVCRIIDALINAMEPLGCSLTNDLGFVVNGETVRLTFSENQDLTNHVLTKDENMQLLKYEDERRHSSWASKPQIRKYDHVFNGRLSLSVGQKSFRDCKSYVLENRLGNVMIELYEAAEKIKKDREAREEAERRRQEEERRKEERRKRYNVEVDRTLALTNLAEDYNTACKIRNYISVVAASGTPDEKTAEWIEWAKAKADWYDPTVAKDDVYFGKREHEKDAEKKELEHKDYWW